ncbi:hypothetical protein [Marivita sp. GX14005]|uniref:hypothetical protein n=1 Tax=Marivita sp. GX14005 TaxID=2942276 RepID=UPI00201851CE|nr:hypothetical protein [Marivita sp. GX14005]MCL3883604.1 hypothetical protein [Marivita sp. GX14005]
MTFKTVLTTTAAALIVSGPAFAYDAWDRDGDGSVKEDEFAEAFHEGEYFKMFDENEDGSIDEDEFNRASFKRYDRDASGDIDEDEYEEIERDFDMDDSDDDKDSD